MKFDFYFFSINASILLNCYSGQEFGRQSLAIKICSCPKRDKQKEENNELEKSQSSARFANKSVETPSMLTVRNSEGFPHPQAEVFRDIKVSSILMKFSTTCMQMSVWAWDYVLQCFQCIFMYLCVCEPLHRFVTVKFSPYFVRKTFKNCFTFKL